MLGCRPRGLGGEALRGLCLRCLAAKLLEKLSEYDIVTPTRVDEFGEPFPTDVHFRRRRRSAGAAPDAWTAAAASSSSSSSSSSAADEPLCSASRAAAPGMASGGLSRSSRHARGAVNGR